MSSARSAGWTGFFAGPAMWFAHQQLSAWLRPVACNGHPQLLPTIAVIVIALLLIAALRSARARSDERASETDRFLTLLGVLSPVLFSVALAFQIAAVLFYPVCAR